MSDAQAWQADYDLLRAQENEYAIEARNHLLARRTADAVLAARKSVNCGNSAEAMLQKLRGQRGGSKP
jgi:hypothetical protein